MEALKRPLKLTPTVQHNVWGKPARESLVAELIGQAEGDKPYAELWFGAHPSSPSIVNLGGRRVPLNELISKYPSEILGDKVVDKFGPALPFLFKVLSIGAALSIQAHPDPELAKSLHQKDPQNYPDSNAKPEIAVALSDFSALSGLLPDSELSKVLVATPELVEIVGDATNSREALIALFKSESAVLNACCKKIYQRLSNSHELSAQDLWVLKSSQRYPEGDPGVLCFYLLDFHTLGDGSAIFNAPNVPHSYLSGDIVECMKNSDNVVRAGMTPKFCDVDTLIDMIAGCEISSPLVATSEVSSGRKMFETKEDSFELERLSGSIQVESQGGRMELVVCLDGTVDISFSSSSVQLSKGEGYLIPASLEKYNLELRSADLFSSRVPAS